MCSVVVDYLLNELNHSGVGYLYFGYKDRTQQTPIQVCSIITKQLLEYLPELPPDIERWYDEKKRESPDFETLKGILFSIPRRFLGRSRQPFIICDALDEMDELNQRQKLLPILHSMADAGFKIFLTSRPHPADVRESFSRAMQIELMPHQEDLRAHVQKQLDVCSRFKKTRESLDLEYIVSTIVASAEGM